jgi:predicted nuclease of predicted toxin-antitoxin system
MSYTPEHFDTGQYPDMRDETDLPILVSAILEDVDILVSRDKDFLDLKIDRPKILDISEYLTQY